MTDDRTALKAWIDEANDALHWIGVRCDQPEVTDLTLHAEIAELLGKMPSSPGMANAPLPAFLTLPPACVDEAELKCEVLRSRLEMEDAELNVPLDVRRLLGVLSDLVAHLLEVDTCLKAVAPAWRGMARAADVQEHVFDTSAGQPPLIELLRDTLLDPARSRLSNALRGQRKAARLCIALFSAIRGSVSEVAKEISRDCDHQKIVKDVKARIRTPTTEDYWNAVVEKGNKLVPSVVESSLLKHIANSVNKLVDQP